MTESVIIAVISGTVGMLFGGAVNMWLISRPLEVRLNALTERIASLEATVKAIARRDRRHLTREDYDDG